MKAHIHASASVQSASIGTGSRIAEFVVIQPDARIGSNTKIGPNCLVESGASLGDNVVVRSGVAISKSVQVGNDVFIGPNVSFTSDYATGSADAEGITQIRDGVTIGGGAIILAGVTIGNKSVIGAGSVVTRSVPANAVVRGNPARIVGYVDTQAVRPADTAPLPPRLGTTPSQVKGVTLHRLSRIVDMRGNLTVGEFDRTVPFAAKRYFMVFDVPSAETRGEHAHKQCHQFLICVRGSCSLVADDGFRREEFVLDRPDLGVHLPPMVWGIQYNYTADAILLVFASHYYDAGDYVRDYSEFQRLVGVTA